MRALMLHAIGLNAMMFGGVALGDDHDDIASSDLGDSDRFCLIQQFHNTFIVNRGDVPATARDGANDSVATVAKDIIPSRGHDGVPGGVQPSRGSVQPDGAVQLGQAPGFRGPQLLAAQPTPVTVVGGHEDASAGGQKPKVPPGADIWHKNKPWVNQRVWHPTGVIANMPGVKPIWANVSHMSLTAMTGLTVVAYPVALLCIISVLAITVSVIMKQGTDLEQVVSHFDQWPSLAAGLPMEVQDSTKVEEVLRTLDYLKNDAPPIIPLDCLTPLSCRIFAAWVLFCRFIPCLMVFGTPAVLVILSRSYPQEVYAVVVLLPAFWIFGNGIHMCIFSTRALRSMLAEVTHAESAHQRHSVVGAETSEIGQSTSLPESLAKQHGVAHWIIIPQYREDVEVVSMTLRSLCKTNDAKFTIGVVLAMEEREPEAKEKAIQLCERFPHEFMEMITTYHPRDLPNDPPGKASNLSWAFATLLQYLWSQERDLSKVLLTISDADSEFSSGYVDNLTAQYLNEDAKHRNLRIWQSPMLHMKNYHRQPAPIIVGTMMTTLQELGALGDPNAVRFPYSTYSLSLELARRVGGWDADWIAEDWHMGIKCYLLTFGRVQVRPIMLPTLNYTPEDSTYWTTLVARWSQAKRHALGFSDMSYYFITIPLMFCYVVSSGRKLNATNPVTLRSFWSMFCRGFSIVVRLVNVHVLLGTITTFGVMNVLLRVVMMLTFSEDRHVVLLYNRTAFCFYGFTVVTGMLMLLLTVLFVYVYSLMKDRLECENGPPSCLFRHAVMHWLYVATSFLVFGLFYFVGLGVCVWTAAVSMLTSRHFEHEVAVKPTTKNRM